jgi:YHS domain-containing protein
MKGRPWSLAWRFELVLCMSAAAAGASAQNGNSAAAGVGSSTAMRGYSPVSLVGSRQWIKGREPYRVRFDGATYLLADKREVQMFRAAPERYAPVFGGDCVVEFSKTGERKAGLLRHGVVHENRLYFFSSDEARQEFAANPVEYMDIDVALGGNCPVCIVELNKSVPGRPELAAVLYGNRYFFPGAQQREMFLAHPLKYAAAAHAIFGTTGQLPTGGLDPGVATTNDAAPGDAPGAETMPPPAEAEPAVQELPLALSGYCPVSILAESRWARGRPEHAVELDGRRYLLASEVHKEAFLAEPARFVPALGGDCVVSLRDHGKRVEGSVYHAVIHRGRQYLFPGLPQKEAFKLDPDAYANVDLALGGNCAVCLVDNQQQVAGKPEHTVWRAGMRYQMAGQEQLEKFQADPVKYASAMAERAAP